MSDVTISKIGAFSCSVCVPKDMSHTEIVRQIENQYPAGTSNGWMISEDKAFHGGEPMPCVCELNPERLHYFVEV